MKKSLLILPLVVIVAALGLAACGGGSSSSGSSGDESAIEAAIEASATSTEPSKCTEFQTAAFNETETGKSGSAATKACEQEVEEEENPAESVGISGISVNGKSATAEVAITGSTLDGQGVELEMVKEEGNWKLNKLLSLTNFDAEALGEAVEEALADQEGVTASQAKCVSEGVAEMSQEEAEAMIFEEKTEPIEEVITSCE